MLVLVTGAAGRLGSATCQQLGAAGIPFRATDTRTSPDLAYRVAVENLLNPEACYRLLEDCTAVVHLANRPNERAGSPQVVYGENCSMNMNVVQAAVEIGVSKIIYASSIQTLVGNRPIHLAPSVPSNLAYLPADGDLPATAGNPYAASKVAGEQLLKYFTEFRGLKSGVAMRFPGMVRSEHYDWYRQTADIHSPRNKGEFIDEMAAWLSLADAGRLIAATLKADLPGYRCYLPAHPSPRFDISPQEMIRQFFSAVPLRKAAAEIRSMVDISRITQETGWTPQDDFRTESAK